MEYIDLRQSPGEVQTIEAAFLLTGMYQPPIVYINGEAKFAASFPREDINTEVARLLSQQ